MNCYKGFTKFNLVLSWRKENFQEKRVRYIEILRMMYRFLFALKEKVLHESNEHNFNPLGFRVLNYVVKYSGNS